MKLPLNSQIINHKRIGILFLSIFILTLITELGTTVYSQKTLADVDTILFDKPVKSVLADSYISNADSCNQDSLSNQTLNKTEQIIFMQMCLMKKDIADNSNELTDLSKTIDTTGNKIELKDLEDRVKELEGSLTRQNSNQDKLGQRIDDLRNSIDTFKTTILISGIVALLLTLLGGVITFYYAASYKRIMEKTDEDIIKTRIRKNR